MRKRQQRHDIIRDIIREHNVKTQRDLANQLQAAGYECTQATISRDIMDMGLVKSREGYYVLPEEMGSSAWYPNWLKRCTWQATWS